MILFAILFSLIFSVFLASKIVKRLNTSKKSDKKGKTNRSSKSAIGISIAYISLVIFCLSILFFPFAYLFLEESYILNTKPSYTAEIVNFESTVEVCDDDGESYDCTMHSSIFKFQLEDGTYLELPSNIRSGAEPEIGKEVKIVYQAGESKVHELSLASIGLHFALLIFLICMGLVLLTLIYYALGYDYEKFIRWGFSFVVNFIMPCSVFLFTGALGYVVWTFLFMENYERHPYWAVGVCIFFLLFLVPLSIMFIHNWFKFVKSVFLKSSEKTPDKKINNNKNKPQKNKKRIKP